MVRIIVIVMLLLALFGSAPLWSYNSGWGYYPVGGFSLLIIIALLFFFRGNSRV